LYWGKICEARQQADAALEYFERAAQAFSAQGDLLGLSTVLNSKAQILDWRSGDHVEAERLQREALSYVGEEHRRQRAALLANLARNQLSAGNPSAAQTLYREALALYESDRQGQLATLLNPGSWLYHSIGDFLQALAVLRRADQLVQELNDPRATEVYNNMSVNLYFLGRYTEARAFAEKALARSRELGDAHQEAYALMNQANALEMTCGMGYSELYQQYIDALHIEQRLDNRRFIIATLVFMMILARHNGEMAEAVRRGQQALALATERGLRWLMGFVLTQLGAAQIWLDAGAARATLQEALQIADDCGDAYHAMVAHFWLASLSYTENNSLYLEHLRDCLRLAVGQNYDYYFRGEMQAAIPLLTAALEHDLWCAYISPILVKMGPHAASSLEPFLSHANTDVRRRAQQVLEGMGITLASREAHIPKRSRRKSSSVPPLTIRAFGNFAVWRAEEMIEERAWGRRKCKRLLKYLALSPGHTLSKDAAIELLSAEAEPQAANANFYRTLYNLRRVLEPLSPESCANYIALDGGLVSLVMENVQEIDVDEFERAVEQGHALARQKNYARAEEKLVCAVRLYGDDLTTDDLYDDWLQPHRERLLNLYLYALTELGNIAAHEGAWERGIEFLDKALKKDGADEALCLKLIHALMQLGRRADALQAYAACERALGELGLEPSEELHAAQENLTTVRAPA
jgi:DNA-binding SARP family transcriptional activator